MSYIFKMKLKKTLASLLTGAGIGLTTLIPNNSQATSNTLNVEITPSTTREYENRFVSFTPRVSGQLSNPEGTTNTLTYRWNFGDEETSSLRAPSHKWDVDANTTFTINLDVAQDWEYTTGTTRVAEGSASTTLRVLDTPAVTDRTATSTILSSGVEGVDYEILNVAPGTDVLRAAQSDLSTTIPHHFIFLEEGEYAESFPYQNLFNTPNVYILGKTRHRGDLLDDEFVPFDYNGTSETTIFKGGFGFPSEGGQIRDLIVKKNGNDVGRIGPSRDNQVLDGIIFDNSGEFSTRVVSTVTTLTINNCLYLNQGSEVAVEINSGPSYEEKYGITVSNTRFRQDYDFLSGIQRAFNPLVDSLDGASGVTAIRAEAPITGRGNIYDVRTFQSILPGPGEELPYNDTYLDGGETRRTAETIATGYIVEGVTPTMGALNSNLERLSTGLPLARAGSGSGTFYGDEEVTISKDGEYFRITGFKQNAPPVIPKLSAKHWELYDQGRKD